ncbi:MAG: cytochrome P450 [Robiginitomaculum sp.]|nr:MAG: cytochrome P450 [Robiginitomaculum sp.]
MPFPEQSDILETAFKALSKNYKGTDVDIYELCKEKRKTEPVMKGDFMRALNVPTHADVRQTYETFVLFKYKDIRKTLADAKTFTSGFIKNGLGSFFGGDGLIILAMDGDQHKKTRALLQPVFMPSNVNIMRDEMDRVVREDFLNHIIEDKKANLMDFGLYFPIKIIYQLLGFPKENTEQFYEYAAMGLTILAGQKIDAEAAEDARKVANSASDGLLHLVEELVEKRRKSGTEGTDLLSKLIVAEHEGERLSNHEIGTFARSLVAAGGETTTRSFSSIMTLLLQRPELMKRAIADRSLIPAIINEGIRFEPVATVKVRQAAKDVEIGGVHIPAGSLVQCIVASANRDEAVMERPEEFDPDRKTPMNFTFGFGPHMCIGQFIAKLELETAINAIFDLLPNLRFDPDMPLPTIEGGHLRGASNIHIIWD